MTRAEMLKFNKIDKNRIESLDSSSKMINYIKEVPTNFSNLITYLKYGNSQKVEDVFFSDNVMTFCANNPKLKDMFFKDEFLWKMLIEKNAHAPFQLDIMNENAIRLIVNSDTKDEFLRKLSLYLLRPACCIEKKEESLLSELFTIEPNCEFLYKGKFEPDKVKESSEEVVVNILQKFLQTKESDIKVLLDKTFDSYKGKELLKIIDNFFVMRKFDNVIPMTFRGPYFSTTGRSHNIAANEYPKYVSYEDRGNKFYIHFFSKRCPYGWVRVKRPKRVEAFVPTSGLPSCLKIYYSFNSWQRFGTLSKHPVSIESDYNDIMFYYWTDLYGRCGDFPLDELKYDILLYAY